MISAEEIVLASPAWPAAAGLGLLGCLLSMAAAGLLGCAPLQRLDPVFPGPAPTLDVDALTPPVEAVPAPGHYSGDPVQVVVEGQAAVGLAPSEYAYLLAIEAWALGWTDEEGGRQPGLIDAYRLCATGRDADRTYCEEQVRARALALQACRRELPKAFLAGTAVGAGVGAGATGALVGSACQE